MVHRSSELPDLPRLEKRHYGEGSLHLLVDLVCPPVRPDLIEGAVEPDHLAVQRIEGAESEVPTSPELGEANIALVAAAQQRIDGRGLKECMMKTLSCPNVGPAQTLDVQRPDQTRIQRHQTPFPQQHGLRYSPILHRLPSEPRANRQ